MNTPVEQALAYLETRVPIDSVALEVVRDRLDYQATTASEAVATCARAERNRDMWKGQCLRQAEELHRLRMELMAIKMQEDGKS